jgi:hypothetical protein
MILHETCYFTGLVYLAYYITSATEHVTFNHAVVAGNNGHAQFCTETSAQPFLICCFGFNI